MSTRKMKRFATIAAIAMIASCVAMPMTTAFAEAGTVDSVDITINGNAETDSVYVAYKLLNLTVTDGVYNYTLNSDFTAILQAQTGKTEEADIITAISKLTAAQAREFADAVYAKIKADATASTKYVEADGGLFDDVDQGYYLIAETAKGSDSDTISLTMLDTKGEGKQNVATKEDSPSLTKKLKEKNDTTGVETDWQDGADYDIGDDVPFQLVGTVSDRIANYNEYFYTFHDKCSAGLAFNKDSVEVYVVNPAGEGEDEPSKTLVDASKYSVVTENLPDTGCTFEIRFADLKTVPGVTGDSQIVVEYTAKLDTDAVLGSAGNPNEACLEYSNNPYFDGNGTDGNGDGKDDGGTNNDEGTDGKDNDGDGAADEADEKDEPTNTTTWDKVIVFTYQVDIDKVDGAGDALPGAGFTLYKWVASEDGEGNDTSDYVVVGEELKAEEGQTMTDFTWKGLDAGQYKLVETTVPTNYNKAADVEFVIEATYDDDDASDPQFGTLTAEDTAGNVISGLASEGKLFTANANDGSLFTEIVNKTGTELPSTGGIGTTIFYVVGGTMAAGAGVYLISKKRMKKDEE